MNYAHISEQIQEIHQRIEESAQKAGRSASEIKLIAVSKTHPIEAIDTALTTGQLAFGENKVQELVPKMEHFQQYSPSLEWHMIGTLQSNKIKYLAPLVDWIHSVSKPKYLKEIEKRAAQADRVINVLIQVDISNEEQKSGCDPSLLPAFFEQVRSCSHVVIRGLMGMAAFDADEEELRAQFGLLKTLRDTYKQSHWCDQIQLEHLSMGMTNDMEIAIEQGATMIRIGTAIFGKRDYT